jgi:3-oxoacyl-[acyl-carrier protein] reductase
MGKLEGQVAIVTGGSRGIGRAVALAFAREGARVAITAAHDQVALHEVEREISLLGVEALAFLADVTRRAEIDRAIKMIVDKWDRIAVLVNNAGILSPAPFRNYFGGAMG